MSDDVQNPATSPASSDKPSSDEPQPAAVSTEPTPSDDTKSVMAKPPVPPMAPIPNVVVPPMAEIPAVVVPPLDPERKTPAAETKEARHEAPAVEPPAPWSPPIPPETYPVPNPPADYAVPAALGDYPTPSAPPEYPIPSALADYAVPNPPADYPVPNPPADYPVPAPPIA